MQGNARVIDELNARLAEELTAVNQYMVHAEMCEDWHYGRLGEPIKKRAITEMKHAERLIERLLFLDARPIVSTLNQIHIGGRRAGDARQRPGERSRRRQGLQREHPRVRRSEGRRHQGGARGDPRRRGRPCRLVEAQLAQIEQAGRENYLAGQIG